MTIIRPASFQRAAQLTASPADAGQLAVEDALHRLAAMMERDPQARRREQARRAMRGRPRFGPATACVGS